MESSYSVDERAQLMHDECRMATKTISLKLDAYERLKRARRSPDESFSDVVLRATWPEETVSGAALLKKYRDRGPWLSDADLSRIEAMKVADAPPEDKWDGT
jgi:hypothetical protein